MEMTRDAFRRRVDAAIEAERMIDAAYDLRNALAELVWMFEESHADEVANDHDGDGPDGCTYCKAIQDAHAALAKAEGK